MSSDIVELRRKVVARFVVRGKLPIEMIQAMTQEGFVNPDTGAPWSAKTIQKDIEYVKQSYTTISLTEVATHRARILTELHMLKERAWELNDFKSLLAAIKQERTMLGVDAGHGPKDERQATNSLTSKLEAMSLRMLTDGSSTTPDPSNSLASKLEFAALEFKPGEEVIDTAFEVQDEFEATDADSD